MLRTHLFLVFWSCTLISVTEALFTTTSLRQLGYYYHCHTKRFLTTTTTTTTASPGNMRYIDAIRHLTDDYDVFLLDMWGVMHNGSQPYKGVLETIKKLKELGKEIIILSNSSKRTDSSIKMLKKLGFDPTDFCQIITSGEVSNFYRRQPGEEQSLSLAVSPLVCVCVCVCSSLFCFLNSFMRVCAVSS